MKRWIYSLAVAAALFAAPAAQAANSTVPAMTAAGAISDTDLFYCVQSAGTTDRKCTPVQLATYLFGKVSSDLTCTSGGACTLKNTGPGATGPLGSATVAPIITIDAQGRVTALTSGTITPAVGSLTGLGTGVGTALGVNVGTAGAFVVLNGAGGTPSAITLTNGTGLPIGGITGLGTGVASALAASLNGSTGLIGALTPTNNNCVVGNGSAWTSAACPGGGGGVTSVATACGVSGGPITTTGTVRGSAASRNATGTTDTITSADCGLIVTENNASAVAVAITTAGFSANDYVTLKNKGAGTATYTPSSGTIGGNATLALATGQSTDIYFDGTNWITLPGTGGGGSGTVSTTGSPANGNLAKFSGSTSITNGDLAGDCVTAGTLTANCSQPHPGYVSGAWSTSPNLGTLASGSALPANNIVCVYEPIPKVLTVTALGAGIGTAGTSNVQFAIYANANGRPSTLIGRTNNIANNVSANTKVEGVLAANKNIGPGGTDGGRDIWFCTNQNDSTATYATIATSNSVGGAYIQSTNLIDVINGIGNGLPSGLLCAGANCNGGSSTFGTWPATLAGSTWTIVSPGSTGNIAPVVYYKAQ